MKYLVLYLVIFCSSCAISSDKPLSVIPEARTNDGAVNWWIKRHQDKIMLKNQMPTVDLVFLGDSITHAWDHKGKAVWQQYYQQRNALNLGFNGDRTEHVLWRINNGAIDDIDPKLLVLMIGTNNSGHRQDPPDHTAKGIKTILQLIKHKLPNTKILLLAIFPRGATEDDDLRVINDEINHRIKHFHDGKQVYFWDINQRFLDDDGVLHKSVMEDLLHPNENQYQIWAEVMEPKIRELMAENI